MRFEHSLRPATAFAGAALWFGAPAAWSMAIEANVEWTLGGVPPAASDTDGPAATGSVDVLDGDTDTSNNSVFYHTYGNTTGTFGSRVSGGGTYDIDGIFTFAETFIATSSAPTFLFEIIPGQIDARQYYGATATDMPGGEEVRAGYEIEVRLDGGSIWSSFGEVWVDDGGTHTHFTGTSIGGSLTLDPGGTFASYSWSVFNGNVALGTFTPGDSFLLEYDLRTFSSANTDADGCTDGGIGGDPGRPGQPTEPGTLGSGCGAGIAQSGDPFSFSNSSAASISGAVPAPAPATLGLLSAGLAGIGALRRRRRA